MALESLSAPRHSESLSLTHLFTICWKRRSGLFLCPQLVVIEALRHFMGDYLLPRW